MSETYDRQKARIVRTIGTQPFIPAVYGVNAPLYQPGDVIALLAADAVGIPELANLTHISS